MIRAADRRRLMMFNALFNLEWRGRRWAVGTDRRTVLAIPGELPGAWSFSDPTKPRAALEPAPAVLTADIIDLRVWLHSCGAACPPLGSHRDDLDLPIVCGRIGPASINLHRLYRLLDGVSGPVELGTARHASSDRRGWRLTVSAAGWMGSIASLVEGTSEMPVAVLP